MSDTVITWHIANLERETTDGFVYVAHYTVDANDGTYSSNTYGCVGFQRPDNLIPYTDLLEEQVIEWVKEAFGPEKVIEIEQVLENQIYQKQHPTVATGVPW